MTTHIPRLWLWLPLLTVAPLRVFAGSEPGGQPGSRAEQEQFAALQARTPDLSQFEGGMHEVIISLLVIAALVLLIVWLCQRVEGTPCH